jgi:hypothetical protein
MEHVIASNVRKVWDKKDWLFEGNMDSGRDIHVKVKQSRFARTMQTHWITMAS